MNVVITYIYIGADYEDTLRVPKNPQIGYSLSTLFNKQLFYHDRPRSTKANKYIYMYIPVYTKCIIIFQKTQTIFFFCSFACLRFVFLNFPHTDEPLTSSVFVA